MGQEEPLKSSWGIAVNLDESGNMWIPGPSRQSTDTVQMPDKDVPPKLVEHSSPGIFVLVRNSKSIFAKWEAYLNAALRYSPYRVLPFILHMCFSEAQKQSNDLTSTWNILIACKQEITISSGRLDCWHDLFLGENNMPVDDVDSEMNAQHAPEPEVFRELASDKITLTNETFSVGNNDSFIGNVANQEDADSITLTGKNNMSVESPREHSVVCSIRSGSILKMPSLRVCFKKKQKRSKCAADIDAVKLMNKLPNQNCKRKFHNVVFRKVSWILLNGNIALDCIVDMLLVPWMRNNLLRGKQDARQRKFLLMFFLIWLLWRLQETIQAGTQWRKYVPYLCNVTNTVRYALEAVMVYTTCYTSMNRYHAVAKPITYRLSRETRYTRVHAVMIGCMIGVLCSIINIIAVHLSEDGSIGTLCMLTTLPTGEELFLKSMIAVKTVSLVLMYTMPCSYMIIINACMVTILPKQQRHAAGTLERTTQEYVPERKTNKPFTSSRSLLSA